MINVVDQGTTMAIVYDIEDILDMKLGSAETIIDQLYEDAWDRCPEEFQDKHGNDFKEDHGTVSGKVIIAFTGAT